MEWRFKSAAEIYPSTLRRELMAALRDNGTDDSDFAAAELIFGELISNAIRHARGTICVCLEWPEQFATLSVHDEHLRLPDSFELPSDPLAESGRGLFIVQTLARDFRLIGDRLRGSAACATLPVQRRIA